jgi:anti-sigma factor RsiW
LIDCGVNEMEHEERYFTLMLEALDDELAADERAELEAHLGVCPDCTLEWRALSAIEALFRQTPILMPAVDFAERTLARLPGRRARRWALGTIYAVLLVSGIAPLLLLLFLVGRYAPILSRPELLGGVWGSLGAAGRAMATVVDALLTGAGRVVVEQPIVIGWLVILAGLVFLWGGIFHRLSVQPARAASRNSGT